jgi:hypothetical protein
VNFTTENAKGATYFQDDFEPAPAPGWVADGLWAVRDDTTTSCTPPIAFSPTHAYWYGQEASCDYDTGARNMGNLTTPMIDLTLVSGPVRLAFWTYFENQGGSWNDQLWVNISTDNFVAVDTPLMQIFDPNFPMNTWNLVELNISSYAGSQIWIRFYFDTIFMGMDNFEVWLIDNVIVDDTLVPFDVVTVEAWNRAPPYVEPGMWGVIMLQLNFTSSPGSSEIRSLTVNLTGVPPSSDDVAFVTIVHDVDGNDFFNPMVDMMVGNGMFPPPPGPYSIKIDFMGMPVMVNPGTPTKLFVLYDINMAPPATVGNWTGVSILDDTYIEVSPPDVMAPFGGVDTFIPGVSTEIVAQTTENLTVEAWDRAPATAQIAQPDVLMLQLNLSCTTGLIRFFALNLNLTGVPPTSDDILEVELWRDINSDDILDTQTDLRLSQAAFPPPPGPYQVTLGTMMPTVIYPGTPLKLFITYSINVEPPASQGNWIGAMMVNHTFIMVGAPDGVNIWGGIDTFSAGSKTQLVAPTSEQLFVEAWNRAPRYVNPGDWSVLMLQLNLSVVGPIGFVTLYNISVNLSGLPPTSDDIQFLQLIEDTNSNDIYEPMLDISLDGQSYSPAPCPCGATFTPWMPISVPAGMVKKLFILYDIANLPQATLGHWIGVSILNESYFNVSAVDSVAPFAGIDTYVPGARTIIDQVDTVQVQGIPKTSGNVPQGALDVVMEQLMLNASLGNITVTEIKVDQTGSGGDGDTSNVYLWDDTNDNGMLNMGDVLLDTQSFVGKILTFSGFTVNVSAGTDESLLIAFDIHPSAAVGQTLRATITDSSYVTVGMPDVVAGFAPIDSNFITIVGPGGDNLTVTGFDLAPPNVNVGELGVEMEWLNLTADSGSITVNSIKIDLAGTQDAADIANVEIWNDTDDNGEVNIGDVLLGSGNFAGGPPPTVTIPLGGGFPVNFGTTETLLVVYDIAVGATPGNTVGVSIVDETYIGVTGPDTVNPFGPLASTNSTILGGPDTLTVAGTDLAPLTVQQGDLNVEMERLNLTTPTGSVVVNSVQVNLSGTGGIPDITNVEIWNDTNGNDEVDAGDVLLGSGPFAGGPPPTVTITLGAGFPVNAGMPETLLVVYDINISATPLNTVGVNISDESHMVVAGPDMVSPFGPITSTNSTIQVAVPDALTVVGTSLAPIQVEQGETDVEMEWLNLTAGSGTVNIVYIKIDLGGSGGDADISSIDIYHDVNDNMTFDPGIDAFLGSGTFTCELQHIRKRHRRRHGRGGDGKRDLCQCEYARYRQSIRTDFIL